MLTKNIEIKKECFTLTKLNGTAMEFLPVTMIMNTLDKLPSYPLPEGYHFRNFKKGDEHIWAEIETAAKEFKNVKSALNQFWKEFSSHVQEMESKCCFIATADGRSIGTATGWYNRDFLDGTYGRLHWVGIHPEFQGKKLGKPLVSRAMELIAKSHQKAYLTTHTTNTIAINLYLDFGFDPYLYSLICPKAWRLIAETLDHPALKKYL